MVQKDNERSPMRNVTSKKSNRKNLILSLVIFALLFLASKTGILDKLGLGSAEKDMAPVTESSQMIELDKENSSQDKLSENKNSKNNSLAVPKDENTKSESKEEKKSANEVAESSDERIYRPAEVAAYLRENGELPPGYMTKSEARELGWDPEKGNLWEVAPGTSIGGDFFGNRERKLPYKKGRQYCEADVNYEGGYRGPERLVYTSDGLIFYTPDHYINYIDVTESFPEE